MVAQKSAVLIYYATDVCNQAAVTFHFTLSSLWRSHPFVLSTQLLHKHSQKRLCLWTTRTLYYVVPAFLICSQVRPGSFSKSVLCHSFMLRITEHPSCGGSGKKKTLRAFFTQVALKRPQFWHPYSFRFAVKVKDIVFVWNRPTGRSQLLY
jgi:hypothetical protein